VGDRLVQRCPGLRADATLRSSDASSLRSTSGTPYEASIYFGGDGIRVEEVAEGQVAQVNGFQFASPGIVIREWPLRGVAVCPYGAEMGRIPGKF